MTSSTPPDPARFAEALETLRDVPGFAAAMPRTLEALASVSARVDAKADEVLLERASDVALVVGGGTLRVFDRVGGRLVPRGEVTRGALVGMSRAVVHGLAAVRVEAVRDAWVLRVPHAALEAAEEADGGLAAALAELSRTVLRRALLRDVLPGVLGALDAETLDEIEARATWVTLRRGATLFRQGDVADGWYVVASGRLQVVAEGAQGEERGLGEVGRGESAGEAAILGGATRTATLHALRDSELMSLRAADLEALAERNPRVALGIARNAVRRGLRRSHESPTPTARTHITVVPQRPQVDVTRFTAALVAQLSAYGPTLHLKAPAVDDRSTLAFMSSLPKDHPAWIRFSSWVEERASGARFVVLEADPIASSWSHRVVREADEVVLVADASGECRTSQQEGILFDDARNTRHARRTLVLRHAASTALPRDTAAWLDARHVDRHLHLRDGDDEAMARIARTLAGEAVSLVLGAGGARGIAHVGVLRAMREVGVPVDAVGGTSIGALVGALVAMGLTPAEMLDRLRLLARRRPFGDYALPVTSVLRGRRVERAAHELFGDVRIEDLWIPYFCNSCDISMFQDVVHTRGPVASAVLASTALPGVLPPQVRDGRLHVDGGTTDMLPGEAMRARSRGPMIAVDVSTERRLAFPEPRYPVSWAALWRRLRRRGPETPSLPELFMRAVSFGVARRTEAVAADAELFLRPPVERFGTVELTAMNEIEALGYAHALDPLRAFRWGPRAT